MIAAAAAAPSPAAAAIASLQAGHLAALEVRRDIRAGGNGAQLVEAARRQLESDPAALAAFGRTLTRTS